MELARPRFVCQSEIFADRPHRAEGLRFVGLWVAGSLAGLAGPTVAVVGSRAPSEGGVARARGLGAALATAGVCVISGLALGIDGAGHAGSLAAGGLTIGVLGGGHRHFFPKRNRSLAEALLEARGAVLSPYPPDEPARPGQFLQRNAVVAALADAIVVVEAAERSGALNTAGWAAALGIDVLAFPGDVDRPKAAGCNALIRDGATLVRDAGDVLDAIGVRRAMPVPDRSHHVPDALERAVLAGLADGPRDLDALVASAGARTGNVLAALVRLQIAGVVERRDALIFARSNLTAR